MKITVKTLIDYIKENSLSENSDISFVMDSGCCGDIECLEPYEIDDYGKTRDNTVDIFIRFAPLPGYSSCRQVGDTARDSAALKNTRKELIRQILLLDGGYKTDLWAQETLLKVLTKTGYNIEPRFNVKFIFQGNVNNTLFYSKRAALMRLGYIRRVTDPNAQMFDLRRKK